MSASEGQVEIVPIKEGQFPEIYSNHVAISRLPEEIYLDFCLIKHEDLITLQNRTAELPSKSQISAPIRARVIVSLAHAKRISEILGEVAKANSAVQNKQ